MSERLQQLSDAGVSIWLDDLSRERIETGNLADLIKDKSVVGVTTNPTIFAGAISDGERYDDEVRRLVAAGADVDKTVFELTTGDVRAACDVLKPVYEATGGVDGRVSIEVAPDLAFDTDATLASARELWAAVDRENLFIKIPATTEGAPAITDALADGISVNVTLIFGLGRYREGDGGLRRRAGAGARQRPGPLPDPLRRVVLRLPRRHRDRQAARGRSAPTRRWPCAARPASPTPGWPTARTSSSSAATGGNASPTRAATPSARCGRPPASRTPTTATRCTSPTWSSPTP